ncbi:hypothetical protein AYO21_10882 [Fonsecaea monophora]|uniref:Uncharacterized protein n=2 Tax=Fonsecaea TaxID=40354 RepID=A0A0D2GQE2_9EURO|nr:uncharacterized protein Z517_11399 [Fonsecaea pedrosoi CBS 271.37]XP_022506883.1 hypothetical protein AYO21_10882 [Fonsecaea monophora]KAH0835176.1 hypothetical protein FOPE_04144 [Fonsecaea pedrosoi]KIW74629.1 hypothetical protein Z517_11399 [Fonsecaea pedrosoi CBS 271.37]OAG34931.1 hypothetical protein AYO21_10882 [Fonsecaea monophora]
MSTHKVSAVTIDEYEFPTGGHARGYLLSIALMILSARRRFIEPGSILHDQLIARSATASKYAKRTQDVLFYFLYGAHSIEAIHFALTKLRKHNVKAFSLPWFQWIIAVFVGGVNAKKHFDAVVEKKELKTIKEI